MTTQPEGEMERKRKELLRKLQSPVISSKPRMNPEEMAAEFLRKTMEDMGIPGDGEAE